MRTDKRTDENQWQCLSTETDLCLGWYPDDLAAYMEQGTVGVSVLYRPKRKKVSK